MSIKTIQDVLPLIEQPSRYLGSEINAIKKDPAKVRLRMALAFPDLYEIGTSHFGLQILYTILNKHEDIAAERVFAPALDMDAYLRSSGIPITSLETGTPLKCFDIIGFSLLYELNFTNILTILDLAGIPFFASQRDASFPLIIAGGPCTCNPEPVADFFDAMIIGDGENVIIEIARTWLKWKEGLERDKTTLLKALSNIEGVYIPAFFEAAYDIESGDGLNFQRLLPKFSNYTKVTRTIINDIDQTPFPENPVVPFGKPVHDRLRLEIARGCTRGCRFCQAGMIYRPVRERSVETILDLAEKSLATTGYEDISLLSLSTGDYGCLLPLMEELMDRYEPRHIAISLPSFRAGTLTPKLMNLVKKVRKTGFTIAPEAGSQRLRDVINKNITEEEIFETVTNAFDLGWQVIKLYFMVGLPTETDEDLKDIVKLVKDLGKIKSPKRGKRKINVSVGTFIPKPHVPFQWESQVSLAESNEKIRFIQDNLKIPGIHFKWQKPQVSILEGLWARGDRRLAPLLVAAYKLGCKFDGWSDKFHYHLWEEALSETGIDIDFYTTRKRDIDEPLPWDHIDTKVSKTFLKQEREKALRGELTSDCRTENCKNCGVCDFKKIEPKVFDTCKKEKLKSLQPDFEGETCYKKLQIFFSKQDQAKYFGHLELVKIFLQAIRRAEIPVKYSKGFHPMPKISFEDPLPLGMESLNECFYLTVPVDIKPQRIITDLNDQLPKGIFVHDCRLAPSPSSQKKDRQEFKKAVYRVTLKEGVFEEEKLEDFTKRAEFTFTRTNRKGRLKKIDLKETVLKIDLLVPHGLEMILRMEPGKTVRPFEVIKRIFDLPEETIKRADVVKI